MHFKRRQLLLLFCGEERKMINIKGYTLVYEPKNNRIVIALPQTIHTLTNTVSEIVDRRVDISIEEEATILNVVKDIMERK